MKAIALLLFVASSLCAQVPQSMSIPKFVAMTSGVTTSVFYPTNISGTWVRWWVASDNPTNTTITNWVDRVSAESLTNTLALSPTNSATGMGFSGSTYLKMKHPLPAFSNQNDTNVLFMILAPVTPATDFSGLWAGDDTTIYSGGRLLFTRTTSKYNWNSGASSDLGAAFLSAGVTDITIVAPRGASTSLQIYTNGILSVSLASGAFLYADSMICFNPNNSGSYKGKILEILRGTNIPPSQVSLVVSNLHYYGTNAYKYSP